MLCACVHTGRVTRAPLQGVGYSVSHAGIALPHLHHRTTRCCIVPVTAVLQAQDDVVLLVLRGIK